MNTENKIKEHSIINCIIRSNYANIPVQPEDDIRCNGRWVELQHANGKILFPGKVLYQCKIPNNNNSSENGMNIENIILRYYISCSKGKTYPLIGDIIFGSIDKPS